MNEALINQTNLLENIADAVITTDANHHITGWNKAASLVYGWEPHEVIGKPVVDLFRPRYPDCTREEMIQQCGEQGYWKGEAFYQRRDGTVLPILLSLTVMKDIDGQPLGYIGFHHDITERKRAEDALRASESRYRRLMEQAVDGIAIADQHGDYLDVNKKMCEMTGYTREELLGMNALDLAIPDEQDLVKARIADTLDGKIVIYERWLLCKDRSRIPVEVTGQLFDLNTVQAIFRDIRERKQTEAALRESEQKYRHLFEYANDSIFIIDAESGQIVDANKNAYKRLGYTRDELLTLKLGDIDLPLTDKAQETVQRQLQTTGNMIFEQAHRRKDGTLMPVEISTRMIRYGDRSAMLSFARDITTRREIERAEHEQRALTEALRDTVASLSSTLDLNEVVVRILTYVARVVPSDTANIMLIEDGIARVIGQRGYDVLGVSDQVYQLRFPISDTPNMLWMVEHKRPFVMNDTHTYPGWVSVPATDWVRAYVGAPIQAEGRVIGFINLDSAKPLAFTASHVETLEVFANHASIAIQNAQHYATVQRHAAELEQRVFQRTAELSTANTYLKEQIEERRRVESTLEAERNLLRTLVDNLPDVVYVKDLQSRFLMINRALRNYGGVLDKDSLIGKTDFDITDHDRAEGFYVDEQLLLQTGVPIINQEVSDVDKNGTRHLQLVTKVPLRDSQGSIIGLIGINRDITELKQAEEQLMQVVMSARCLLWYAIVEERDGVYDWSLHVSNEAAAQRFLPLEVPPGRSYSDIWDESRLPEDKNRIDSYARSAIRAGLSNYTQEFRCRRSDGSLVWINEDVQIKPLTPRRWALVGICTDITERKRAEETLLKANDMLEKRVQERTAALTAANTFLTEQIQERERAQQAERDQRILAEALRDVAAQLSTTLVLDTLLNGILTYVERVVPHDGANIMFIEGGFTRFIRHHGYSDLAAGLMFNVEDFPDLRRMMTSGQPRLIRDTQLDPDWLELPEVGWIRSCVSAPIKVGGKVIGFLNLDSATPNAFTEEHAQRLQTFANQAGIALENARLYAAVQQHAAQLEERVAERTQELERQRAQLQAILDAMGEGVTGHIQVGETYMRFTNQALTDLTGYTAENWDDDLFRAESMSAKDYQDFRDKMLATLQHQGIWKGDLKLRCLDGQVIDVSVTSTLLKLTTDSTVTIIRDISQEKALREQKDRFIANAAHELRTPLANIMTRLYLIRRQKDRIEEHLEVVESVAQRMRKLVDDLLDQSRFERGKISLAPRKLTLQPLLQDILKVQQPEAANKNIQLAAHLPESPLVILGDEARLIQVFTNLVVNAINYTSEGGQVVVDAAPELGLDGVTEDVVICVRDTGVGITPEMMTQIFTPFFRANEGTPGTGLGLSIAKEIVHLHGGEITVESVVGGGSCFKVRLPLISAKV